MILPTGRALEEQLKGTDLPWFRIGRNPGFGAAVRFAVERRPALEWIGICNDDVVVSAEALGSIVQRIERGKEDSELIYFDPAPPRPFPGPIDVFTSIALLDRFRRRIPAARPAECSVLGRTHYRPFSFVMIASSLWDRLGGMDPLLVYTYEDADFARRAANASVRAAFLKCDAIRHNASTTSRAHIREVLPVSTVSSLAYLQKYGCPRLFGKSLLVLALTIRILVVPFASASTADHLVGIGRALRAVVFGGTVALPSYQEN
ncbi:glycosyltransferase family 2 protein [Actinotalea ferrariae]|uniref:glycosyltransferase family 2 protein n=1 Tax=Actinotalea ferrariae TaxID=1386098 RepID=UPI0012DE8134|nr:hypothetical protein [Actinotalea ferrariae]